MPLGIRLATTRQGFETIASSRPSPIRMTILGLLEREWHVNVWESSLPSRPYRVMTWAPGPQLLMETSPKLDIGVLEDYELAGAGAVEYKERRLR